MKIKSSLMLIGIGVGGTLLYQNIKNGNMKKITKKMNSAKTKMLEDLEEMM